VFIELTDMDIDRCIPLKVAQDLASDQSSRREEIQGSRPRQDGIAALINAGAVLAVRKEVRRYDPNALLA